MYLRRLSQSVFLQLLNGNSFWMLIYEENYVSVAEILAQRAEWAGGYAPRKSFEVMPFNLE